MLRAIDLKVDFNLRLAPSATPEYAMTAFQPLQLPNGTTVFNRIAKAAMEENLADASQGPSAELLQLYQAWAEGGAGLLLTGNVMVDRRAMTGPGGVVLEDERQLDKFREWARIGRAQGAQFWMQINHPGRQMQANLGQQTVAPSAVALELGGLSKMFPVPKALDEAENRARLLLEVVKAVRALLAPSFCVAVKLNSADFQRGGFDAADAKRVVQLLNPLDVDLVELSGGSYEAPAMQGDARDGRTLAREAYFLEFAGEIAAAATMPVMVTGCIRRLPVVEQVLASGVAMAGIAAALAIDPALHRQWQAGQHSSAELPPIRWN